MSAAEAGIKQTLSAAPQLEPSVQLDEPTRRPAVAERQESSHEYFATGLDSSPKSFIRGHRKTPSLKAHVIKTDEPKSEGSVSSMASQATDDSNDARSLHTEANTVASDTTEITQMSETSIDTVVEKEPPVEVKLADSATYPRLPAEANGERPVEDGSRIIAGIRFAPLRVPFVRRLQTAAVLFHCMSIVAFVSIFFFLAAIPLNWPLLVPYLIYLSFSTAATDGKLTYRNEYIRSLPLWKLFAGYFPARLHKTHDLPPTRKYIFGYHPHGIISHGAWAAFATNALGFADKFPGITNTLLTLDSNFRIPLYRDWLLRMGICSVSKESITNILSRGGHNKEGMGRAVTIVVGGARESLAAEPGLLRLILQGRKGFVKMAIKTGADLVPVMAFGENDLYEQLSPQTHPLVHKFQMFVLHVFKFTLPAMHGRGLFNYDVGLMPHRREVNIVVGRPIHVVMSAQPAQEEVNRIHSLYVAELKTIWETYKDDFAKDRKAELEFIG